MILAFDTYYFENKAKTVCISFDDWSNEENYTVNSEIIESVEEYVPGEFYRRELPCIMSLLEKTDYKQTDAIIVDGFVYLDDDLKPGLGAHLYNRLEGKIPVIGVAKTNFATLEYNKRPVLRGESANPLYITAIGIDLDVAAELIKNMNGPYRIPTLLKTLDTITKEKMDTIN